MPEAEAATAATTSATSDGPARSLRTRALVILGVASVAVVQPLLDLFGRNPEFFVAGRYSTAQIVAFAVVIAFVPPAVGIALTAVATVVHRRAGTIVFGVVVTAFAIALVMAVLRTVGVDAAAVVLVVAVLVGAGLAALVVRTRGGMLLASYLSVANLLFVGSFLFLGPTSQLVVGSGALDVGEVEMPALEAPVVWIVLDEFPAATIMDADGSINAERYPGFADLASVSSWYRNASSQYNLTHRAVPSQLTGTMGDQDDLPTAMDHPRNLFTLLGSDVPVHRYESVTDLCPADICERPPRQPLARALEDASVVYGHRVLPEAMRDELPVIDNSWGAYGAEDDGGSTGEDSDDATAGRSVVDRAYEKWRELGADEKSPLGQAGILREAIDAIDGEPSVHFAHVALPHRPWTLSASGVSTSFAPELITDPAAPGYEFGARLDYQLHSMQVGAADVVIGELVDHLRSLPTWEDTLLVVTSDHGTNLSPPDIGRMTVTDENREEVYRLPLFIKAPGQVDGEVRDDSAQSIDILPTVVDLLDAEVDWEFAGHSLADGSAATTDPQVSTDVDAVLDIAARRAEQFPHGGDWLSLAAVGVNGDLVGQDVADLTVGEPSELRTSLDQQDLFAVLPTDEGTMPFVLAGTVDGPAEPTAELVAAINGRIAGVVGGYRPAGGGWAFNGYVADLYRQGSNDVELFEVTRDGDAVTLHRTTT